MFYSNMVKSSQKTGTVYNKFIFQIYFAVEMVGEVIIEEAYL